MNRTRKLCGLLVFKIGIVVSMGNWGNAQSAAPEPEQPNVTPKLVAMAWQLESATEDEGANSTFWNAKGELLSEREVQSLRDEIGIPSFLSRGGKYSTPLILVFEFDDSLPPGTGGVGVTAKFANGTSSSLGTRVNRQAGKKTPNRHFAISSSVVSTARRTFSWPKTVELGLRYPAEAPKLIKEVDQVPEAPILLARGVSWSVEKDTGYEPGGDGTRYPAGVLEISEDSLDLLEFRVRIYKKGNKRPLRGSYSTIRERDDQRYEIRVSERFPDDEELDRIEFYRQRFKRSTLHDVPLRIDLLPDATGKN